MRCFLGCFTASSKPTSKRLNAPSPTHVTAESLPLLSSSVDIPITEPLGKNVEEQLSRNGETRVTSSNCSEKTHSVVAGNNEEKRVANESRSKECNLISSEQASGPQNPRDLKNDGDGLLGEEESSESLFSISIDSRKYTCAFEGGEKEVSSPMPKCETQSAVLAPIGNLPQLRTAKSRATLTLQTQDKENINTDPNASSFQVLSKTAKANSKRHFGEEIAVDASLSSWLNTPILGTVGSFWHHTGRSVDSESTSSTKPVNKCAKDDEVSSHSTPFKARLDRALCEIVNQN